jgi:hypothetical protein
MSVFTFARVDRDTLTITLTYNTNGGTKWADGDLECPFPFDILADQATRDPETGEITLTQDPLKVQAKLAAAWTQLRAERNARLAASDWTQLADAHLSQEKKDAWAAYRQELRDLPDELVITGAESLVSVPWPLDPTQVAQVAPTGSRLNGILGQV